MLLFLLQAKLLGLNAMSVMGLDVAKYWSSEESTEGADVPEAKRLKLDSAEVSQLAS